jgi:hypothetical protein
VGESLRAFGTAYRDSPSASRHCLQPASAFHRLLLHALSSHVMYMNTDIVLGANVESENYVNSIMDYIQGTYHSKLSST